MDSNGDFCALPSVNVDRELELEELFVNELAIFSGNIVNILNNFSIVPAPHAISEAERNAQARTLRMRATRSPPALVLLT